MVREVYESKYDGQRRYGEDMVNDCIRKSGSRMCEAELLVHDRQMWKGFPRRMYVRSDSSVLTLQLMR